MLRYANKKAGIAQLVEQRTENPCVTSSNLVSGIIKLFLIFFSYHIFFLKGFCFIVYFETIKQKPFKKRKFPISIIFFFIYKFY
jgi:hypothetical protein